MEGRTFHEFFADLYRVRSDVRTVYQSCYQRPPVMIPQIPPLHANAHFIGIPDHRTPEMSTQWHRIHGELPSSHRNQPAQRPPRVAGLDISVQSVSITFFALTKIDIVLLSLMIAAINRHAKLS